MLFSVIIPTYNRANFIETTIRSVLSQTYANFEVLVVDDGGNDNTEEIVKGILDNRVKYFKKANEERAAARNYGTGLAKGLYVTFFDSDDILLPIHLAEANKIIERKNNPEWFHLGYKITSDDNNLIKKVNDFNKKISRRLLSGNFLSCNGVFIRKDIAKENKFNETRELSASEDHELWLRMASKYPLNYSNNITSVIINHLNRSVLSNNEKALILRQECFLNLILNNPTLQTFIHKSENKIISNSCSYIALHIALIGKNKKVAIKYLLKSISKNYCSIFSKRFLVTLKYIAF